MEVGEGFGGVFYVGMVAFFVDERVVVHLIAEDESPLGGGLHAGKSGKTGAVIEVRHGFDSGQPENVSVILLVGVDLSVLAERRKVVGEMHLLPRPQVLQLRRLERTLKVLELEQRVVHKGKPMSLLERTCILPGSCRFPAGRTRKSRPSC